VVVGAKQQTDDALTATADAKRDAEDALLREKQRAKEAEERFRIARSLADEHIRVANEELVDDFMQDGLRQRMLQTALAYYQEFIALRKDDPKAVEELNEVRVKVSGILSDLAVMAGAGRLDLLKIPDVRKELKLSEAEGKRLVDQLEADKAGFGKRWLLTEDEFLDRAKRLEKEIRPQLTADQQKRLDQLFIQSRGGRAFEMQEVIDALKLTNEDREKLRQAERKFVSKQVESAFAFSGQGGRGPGGGPGGPGGPGFGKCGFGGPGGGGGGPGGRGGRGPDGRPEGKPDGGPDRPPPHMSAVPEMVAALRTDQQLAWKQLVGETAKYSLNIPFGGGFGGGPGGLRPGGGRP
jgi:hypothetical protein